MPADEPTIEQRLSALEQASDERRAELRRLAAAVPAALSRRALVAGLVDDLRHAPNRGEIARRGARKLLRAPAALLRRLTRRLGGGAGHR